MSFEGGEGLPITIKDSGIDARERRDGGNSPKRREGFGGLRRQERRLKNEHFQKIFNLTIGRTEAEKNQVLDLLGGRGIEANENLQLLKSICEALNSGKKAERLLDKTSPRQKAQLQSLLALTGADEVLTEIYGRENVFPVYRLLVGKDKEETVVIFREEGEITAELASVIQRDKKGKERASIKRLTALYSQLNEPSYSIEVVEETEEILNVYDPGIEEMDIALWEVFVYDKISPSLLREFDDSDYSYLIDRCQQDPELLKRLKKQVKDIPEPEPIIAKIDQQLLFHRLKNGEEIPYKLLQSSLFPGLGERTILAVSSHWKRISEKQRELVLSKLDDLPHYPDFVCQLLEERDSIPPEFLSRVKELDNLQKAKILTTAISEGRFDQVAPYSQDYISQELIMADRFGSWLKKAVEKEVPFPSQLVEVVSRDPKAVERAVAGVVAKGGVELYSQIPQEIRNKAISQQWSLEGSKRLLSSLIEHQQLENCPFELLERVQVGPETVLDWFNKGVELEIPEVLQAKVVSLELTPSQKTSLLEAVVYRGDLDLLAKAGGQDFLEKCLDASDVDIYQAEKVLTAALEAGWPSVPQEIKEFLGQVKWKFFSEQLFQTQDGQFIATIAEKSGLKLSEVEKHIDFSQEDREKYRALFVGCSLADVERALNLEEFQTQFPEYYKLAQETSSLGEKALIVRAAYKGIEIGRLNRLIDLARTQPHLRFETISVLTGLHRDGIYWETWEEADRTQLIWDKEMRRYFFEGEKKFTAEELIDEIEKVGDPSDRESIFYLLENSSLVLKEGEELSQKDYQELCWVMFGRNNASTEVLDELAVRAGWTKPEHYRQLLEREMRTWPSAERIKNITLRGNIPLQEYKEISWLYLDSQTRLSGEAFKVIFDHLRETDYAYTPEEKRRCWNRFRERTLVRTMMSREIEIFEREGVLQPSDYKQLLRDYITSEEGGYGLKNEGEMVAYLLPRSCQLEAEVQEYLKLYLSEQNPRVSIGTLELMRDFIEDKWGLSEQTKAIFADYFQRENIDFDSVLEYLEFARDYLSLDTVRRGIIRIAQKGEGIDDKLIDILDQYQFSQEECRRLTEYGIEHQNFSYQALEEVVNRAGFSQEEKANYLQKFLENVENPMKEGIVQVFVESLPFEAVEEIARDYLLNQPRILGSHLKVLTNFLRHQDEQRYVNFWEEIKTAKPEYRFFDPTELRKNLKASQELRNQGYLFEGVSPIESEDPLDLQKDSRGFYRNHLIYWENKGWLTQEQVKEILGEELYSRLEEVKRQALNKVLSQGEHPWFLNRERALANHWTIMGHGTYQAVAREKGVARPKEERLGAQETVRLIIKGPDGIGIRGEKATIGAFSNPGTKSGYGQVEDGSMVVFFTDDLLKSHIAISTDPSGGDGWVGREASNGLFVQIPNRVCLNPQAGSILGTQLNSIQMAGYLMQLRYELNQYPDLVKQIEEAGLRYEREYLGEEFIREMATIHLQMRKKGYPEGGILWARDYYLGLALSSDPDEQNKFRCLRKVIRAVQSGRIDEDIRSLFDNIRLSWDFGLREKFNLLLPAEKIVREAKQIMVVNQRKAYLMAMRSLKDAAGEYIGVARQIKTQSETATRFGDVPQLELKEVLGWTRAVFLDTTTSEEYQQALEKVEQLAEYITQMKRSVLRTTFNRAVARLPEKQRAIYKQYQDRIALCDSGSGGRGEVVVSSDLDYLVFLDDTDLAKDDLLKIRECLYHIGKGINDILASEYFIRPDPGLANRDRQPVVLLSKVANFNIDLGASRQEVEPTEILDAINVHPGKEALVAKFKQMFLARNAELLNLGDTTVSDYLQRDVAEYLKLYNGGLSQFLSGDQLVDFKKQLQRIFNFKLYALLASAFERIKEEGFSIPSSTLGKIQLLAKLGVISREQAGSLRELELMFYRLRYRADVLNSAQLAQIQEKSGEQKAKVIAKFDPRTLSSQERSRILELFTEFNKLISPLRR